MADFVTDLLAHVNPPLIAGDFMTGDQRVLYRPSVVNQVCAILTALRDLKLAQDHVSEVSESADSDTWYDQMEAAYARLTDAEEKLWATYEAATL